MTAEVSHDATKSAEASTPGAFVNQVQTGDNGRYERRLVT